MNTTKPWWRSKTIWVNLCAVVGSIAVSYGFDSASWAEITAVCLGVVNMTLRMTTNEGLTLDDEEPR